MITASQIHWMAGLLEGEGTFCYTTPMPPSGKRRSIRIGLAMIDRDIIYRFANLVGFGSLCQIKPCESRPKLQYRWETSGTNAAGLMMTIYSLMGERRQAKIRELLEFYKSTKAARKSVKQRKRFIIQ